MFSLRLEFAEETYSANLGYTAGDKLTFFVEGVRHHAGSALESLSDLDSDQESGFEPTLVRWDQS